ncbi:MAG: Hpt domain-containing protein [Bryobacterales bacterium]
MDFGVDNQVLRSFQQEVRNYLPVIQETAREGQAGDPRRETVRELARTIGSAASVLGLAELHDAAGQLERGLDTPDPSGDDSFLSALACLEQFSLEEIEEDEPLEFDPAEFDLWPEDEDEAADEPPPAPVDEKDEILSEEMLEVYQLESEEHLGFVAQHLAELEQDPSRRDLVQEVRRSIHTLKGAAAMVGLRTAGALAKRAQDFLDQVCEGAIELTPEVLKLTTNVATTLDKLARIGVPDEALRQRAAELKNEMGALLESGAEDIARLAEAVAPVPAPPPPEERADELASQELLETFQEEAEEQLETAVRALRALEADAEQREELQELRRAVHTLKGAAGMVGLNTAASLAHRAEDLLDQLFESGHGPGPEALQLLFATTDMLQDLAKAGVPGEDMLSQARELREAFGTLPAGGAAQKARPGLAGETDSLSAAETAEAAEADHIVSDEMLEVYQAESEEHLGLIARHLRGLESEPNNQELVQEVRRSVHTLKGAAGVVGLYTAGKLAHRAEDYLDEVFGGKRSITPDALRLLFETADNLDDLARAGLPDKTLRARALNLQQRFGELLARDPDMVAAPAEAPLPEQPVFEEALTEAPESLAEPEGVVEAEAIPQPEDRVEVPESETQAEETAEVHADPEVETETELQVEETPEPLATASEADGPPVALEAKTEPNPIEEADSVESRPARPPKQQPERKPPARVTQSVPQARPAAASAEHSASGQFVRVPIERVDELVRMVAELVVHRSTLEQQYSRYSRELGEHDLTTGRLRRLAVQAGR